MFGSIGMPELLIILTLALIIFGPRKLPELGRSLDEEIRIEEDRARPPRPAPETAQAAASVTDESQDDTAPRDETVPRDSGHA